MFTVNIRTDNDIFVPGPGEVQRILAEIIRDLTDEPNYTKYRTIFDINGNDVGRWKYAP